MKSYRNIFIFLFILLIAVLAIVYFATTKSPLNNFADLGKSNDSSNANTASEIQVTFVPVDPDNPVALPKGTIGGSTACERIYNLKACLKGKDQKLFNIISERVSSSGATIEEGCENDMTALMEYRMESIQSGCIF